MKILLIILTNQQNIKDDDHVAEQGQLVCSRQYDHSAAYVVAQLSLGFQDADRDQQAEVSDHFQPESKELEYLESAQYI